MDYGSAGNLLETYTIIFYIGVALCAVFLAITLILFFKYNIIGIIGDRSGSNARKGIENIRNQNRATGNKAHKPSHVNLERGKVTDKISKSGNLVPAGESVGVSVGTEKFHTGKLVPEETSVLGAEETSVLGVTGAHVINETTVLGASYNNPETTASANETTVLGANYSPETSVLSGSYSAETTVLAASYDETTVLSGGSEETTVLNAVVGETVRTDIVIEEEIIFVHSNEQIN